MEKLFSGLQQTLTQLDKNKLLKDLQTNQEIINNLIENVSDMTICDSSCQQKRGSSELQQKYFDANTNMLIPPINLESADKNYYVFSNEGTQNNKNDTDLQIKASKIAETIQQKFNEEITNANTMNTLLNTTLITSQYTIKLFEELLEKNRILKEKVKETQGDILTNSRKTYYETEALETLDLWHIFFLIVYFIIVIILCLSFGFAPHNLSLKSCIVISVLIIFYPLYINYIVKWICGLWKSFKKIIPKNVYNDL